MSKYRNTEEMKKKWLTVEQLIEQLQACNPKATVGISLTVQLSEHSSVEEDRHITGICPWPQPKETANHIELFHE